MGMFEDETGGPATGQLPIVDYNHLAGRTAESYFPGLGPEALGDLLCYEQAHRNRLPIIRSLTARLRRLRHEQDGRTLSAGRQGLPPAATPTGDTG
jgi:hypothetical protein